MSVKTKSKVPEKFARAAQLLYRPVLVFFHSIHLGIILHRNVLFVVFCGNEAAHLFLARTFLIRL